MKKEMKRLQELFGVVKPTVILFEARLKEMDEKSQDAYKRLLCRLAFGYYDELPPAYKTFIHKYFKHDRACYIDYLSQHTVLHHFRYSLLHPKLFVKLLHLLETSGSDKRTIFLPLASCLLLVFSLPYTLSTLAEYLRTTRHSTDELLALLGKVEIGDDDV